LAKVAAANEGEYKVVVSNSAKSVTSDAVTLTVRPAPASSPVTTGLTAYLKFDDTYADASGNGVTASAVGAPVFDAGYLGRGIHIKTKKDGSVNDYVTLGYPASLKFGATSDFSVSFWVKILVQADDHPFISNKDWGSSDNQGWGVFSQSGGNYRVNISGPNRGADKFSKTSGATVGGGAWHLLTVTVQRGGSVKSFVDGNLIDSNPITTQGSIDTDDAGKFINLGQDGNGTYTDGGGSELEAIFDEVALWNRALSADEVGAIYLGGVAGKDLTAVATVVSGPTVNPAPSIPGLTGGAFTDVQTDTGAKTISAKLPTSGAQGFLTITPGVTVKSVQVVGDRLVISYE
jgi:hypothetical protein